MNEEFEKIEKAAFLKEFGEHIRQVRLKKGMSAAEFSRRAFMERSQIARIEMGRANPTIFTLKTICKALDITFVELLEGFDITKFK
jgi:transcriptional regulator with XRE-family HTH domain